jgi:hypothetical protein
MIFTLKKKVTIILKSVLAYIAAESRHMKTEMWRHLEKDYKWPLATVASLRLPSAMRSMKRRSKLYKKSPKFQLVEDYWMKHSGIFASTIRALAEEFYGDLQ